MPDKATRLRISIAVIFVLRICIWLYPSGGGGVGGGLRSKTLVYRIDLLKL